MEGIKIGDRRSIGAKDFYKHRRAEIAALTRSGYSMPQIAKTLGISRQAVSLLLKKAVSEGHIVYKRTASPNDNANYKVINNKTVSEVKCAFCNKNFITRKKRKTCSLECAKKSRKIGGQWSRYEFIELTCSGCSKVFKRSNYLQKIVSIKNSKGNYYCTRNCYLYASRQKTQSL